MSSIATAVIGAAVIGAVASNQASKSASADSKAATAAAMSEQDKALAATMSMSQPYRDLGTSNVDTYQALLTGQTRNPDGSLSSANPKTMQSTLENLPGYQFTRDQGVEAAKRSAAASGMNLSGNQVLAVENYGASLADSTYAERLNQLLQPVQLGQAAAAGQAVKTTNAANNNSSALLAQGNTLAGIDANQQAAYSKILGNAGNQLVTYKTMQGLNNPSASPTYGGSAAPTGDYSYAPLATPDPVTTAI